MYFDKAYLLWGLLLISIPIVIHLLNLRKVKKVYFSNLLFLQLYKDKKGTKAKLTKLILLLIRCATVALVILAFAKLFLGNKKTSGQRGAVAIVVDNSISLEATNGDRETLDEVAKTVDAIVDQTSPDIPIYFYSQQIGNATLAMEAQEVKMTASTLRSSGLRHDQTSLLAEHENTTFFYFSDFQKNQHSIETPFDSTNLYYFVPFKYDLSRNVGIDSVYISKPINFGSDHAEVSIVLRQLNKSDNDIPKEIPLKVLINGTQRYSSTVTMSSKNKEVFKVKLNYDAGVKNKCIVEIEDYSFRPDNYFYFTMSKEPRKKVYVISENRMRDAHYEALFGNDSLFDFRLDLTNRVDFTEVETSDLVILSGVSDFGQLLPKAIGSRKRANKPTFIIPSRTVSSSGEILSEESNISYTQSWEGDTLGFHESTKKANIFSNVFRASTDVVTLPQVYKYSSLNGDFEPIINLENGSPGIIRVLGSQLYAFTFSLEESDFKEHVLFLPLFYQILARQSGSKNKLYYFLDDNTINIELDQEVNKTEIFRVKTKDGEFVPDQKIIGQRRLLLSFPENIQQGFLTLFSGQEYVADFAFNYSRLESDFRQYSGDELLAKGGENLRVVEGEDTLELLRSIKKDDGDNDFWRLLVLSVIILLLIETAILRTLK